MKTIFEKSQKGQHAYSIPSNHDAFTQYAPPKNLQRSTSIHLPEVSEIDLTRHFTNLAKQNMSIDTNFYPLGSCTMKLNPRINEYCASLPGFTRSHPLAEDSTVQGNLEIIFGLIHELCRISGMSAGTLLPNAGAQGEFVGIQMIKAYHKSRNEAHRNEVLIPDDAHGTNSATAAMAGLKVISVRSTKEGMLDLDHLNSLISNNTAALMLTNPNTLGVFNSHILEVSSIMHKCGGLLYYDGANLNPLLNICKPGDMGFDVMHINLHKTFSTPHGGGGPGSGPVLCNDKLKDFLPTPQVKYEKEKYSVIWDKDTSIGRIATFHGNFGIYLRAYLYIKLHGALGLRRIAEISVLNANYLKHHLKNLFKAPYDGYCMHEFVLQADRFLSKGIKALDIAKRLLDYGVCSPTIYFPLIVKECLLIEPTESESKDTLDNFIEILKKIVEEVEERSEWIKEAPHSTPVRRLNEVLAVKNLKLKHVT